tara:strand:- start:297 stop:488 length:192 start_codon:yes stop_codon:yes gene_type:complete
MEKDLFNFCLDHKLNDALADRNHFEIERSKAEQKAAECTRNIKNLDIELKRIQEFQKLKSLFT